MRKTDSFNPRWISTLIFAALLTAGGGLTSGTDQTLTPIENAFSDAAKWRLGTKSWTLANGILRQDNPETSTGAEFLPGQYLKWDGYVVTVQVKPGQVNPAKAGAYLGVKVKGVCYLLRKDGLWAVYPGKNQKMDGTFKPYVPPENKWFEIRIVTSGKKIRGYLDGQPWLALADAPSPDQGISLVSSHLAGEFTGFKVIPLWENEAQELAGISTKINLLANSSFESVPEDLPACWRHTAYPHQWPNEEDYFGSFTVTEEAAFEGKCSACLVTKEAEYPAGLLAINHINLLEPKGVFSVYLKAEQEQARVELSTSIGKQQVVAGREWQRFSLNIQAPQPGARINVSVALLDPGKLLVDAAQFEFGQTATPYQPEPPPLDQQRPRSAQTTAAAPPKVYPVPMITEPITLDGNLDEPCWATAAPLELKLLKTQGQSKEPARAKVVCDQRFLYVGFNCMTAPGRNIPTDEATRRMPPWTIDCVEFLLDPSGQRRGVFQLAANLAGVRGGGQGRLGTADYSSWTGDWETAGKSQPGGYTIEMKVPLAILGLDETTPRRWPFNLARTNPATSEFICSSPCLYSFHDLETYAELTLPDALDLKPFAVRILDLKLAESDTPGIYDLAGKILNGTGRQQTFILTMDPPSGTHGGATQKLKAAAGGLAPFCVTGIKPAPGTTRLKLVFRIANQEGTLIHLKEAELFPVPNFSVFTEFSFFSSEKTARVFLERTLVPPKAKSFAGTAILLREGQEIRRIPASGQGKHLIFPFELAGLAPGQYTVQVTIQGHERTARTCPFIVRTPLPGETKIDHLRRCAVIHGKSTLVFLPNVMTYVDLTENFWKLMAGHDIRTILVWPGRPHINRLGEYITLADQAGVGVLYATTPQEPLVARPNLLGWLVEDEPTGEEGMAKTIATVDHARKSDPAHLVYVNHMPPQMAANYAGLPGDIISIDYYPLVAEGRSIWEVGALTRKMEALAAPRRIPSWFLVQGSYLNYEPTSAELSAQTYMVLINGGTSVGYFFGLPQGQRAWQRYVELNREMAELNDILLSIEERPMFTQLHPDQVCVTTRSLNGVIYLLAVNGQRETVNEAFSLPDRFGTAEVLFESRSVPLANGLLRDGFAPFQRHVYRIERGEKRDGRRPRSRSDRSQQRDGENP